MEVKQLQTFNDKNMVSKALVRPWSENPQEGWIVECVLISEEVVRITKVRSEIVKIYKSMDATYSDLVQIGVDSVEWILH